MNIKKTAAIALGKAVLGLTKTLIMGGGSAAPGLYALKVYPDLVGDLTQQIPKTIIITGTNGKTTTARMLAQIIQASGLKVLRNSTGSNLERGIASTLISNSHLGGGIFKSVDLAIWELDEAAFNTVVPKMKPDMIVFLNAFRDQLDRYGEIDTVIKKWQQTLKQLNKDTLVILNGDDQNILKLKNSFSGKIQTFGVKGHKISGENIISKPKKQKLNFEAKNVETLGIEGSKFELEAADGRWEFTLPIPGIYHIYDFLAAYACAQQLEIQPKAIINSFKNFSPAFGRVEKLDFGYIFLIKNPAGATEVFKTLKDEIKEGDRLLLALNDNLADGTDVSWIWDAQFENLKIENSMKNENCKLKIFCSGTRAEDLALRLKYAGFKPESITVENNLEKAFKQAREGLEGRLFILPTYTALLQFQKILVDSGLKKHYWEEKS